MEDGDLLSETNEIDLFSLTYVFMPRIRQSLNRFVEQWNNYSLSTEQGASPLQLWQRGMLLSNLTDDYNYFENPDAYGMEDDITLMAENEEQILVPDLMDITEQHTVNIMAMVPNPLEDEGPDGVLHYLRIRNYLRENI